MSRYPGSGVVLFRPKEPEREQWPCCRAHRVHDVRRIVDKAANARLMPWIVRLAPLSVRQHDVDLLGRMTMVGISRVRRHEAHADPDIAPYLEPLRTSDCRVGVAIQELLALRLGAGPELPVELRFDGRQTRRPGRRQGLAGGARAPAPAPDGWQTGNRVVPARPVWVDGVRSAANIRSAAARTGPSTPEPSWIAASAEVRNRWRSGERSDVISGSLTLRGTSWHTEACLSGVSPEPRPGALPGSASGLRQAPGAWNPSFQYWVSKGSAFGGGHAGNATGRVSGQSPERLRFTLATTAPPP